jgi:hypothetical protein
MTYSINQLKGSFPAATIFTIDDIEEIKLAVTAVDMREEIIGALVSKPESYVIFCTHKYPFDVEQTLFCLFPDRGCGGVCCGGLTEWFSAIGLDNLEDQWLAGQSDTI